MAFSSPNVRDHNSLSLSSCTFFFNSEALDYHIALAFHIILVLNSLASISSILRCLFDFLFFQLQQEPDDIDMLLELEETPQDPQPMEGIKYTT